MSDSKVETGKVYKATRPSEDWGTIEGQVVSFEEKVIYVKVLSKPDKVFDGYGVVTLPEHLNRPEWFYVRNINTDRDHWINTIVYSFEEMEVE